MVRKQSIQLEFRYTPTDAPQVCSSVSASLNSDQSCSVANKVLDCISAEEDQQEVKPEQNIVKDKVSVKNQTKVFVLSYKGQPLMPCSPRKARKLLKDGKAVVIKARPFFTIKLTQNTGGAKQDINLNVDSGYELSDTAW